MLRLFIICIPVFFLVSSCTMILSTNVPGKTEISLPKEWLGRYEVISESRMPEKNDSAKIEKEYATIENNRITWESMDGTRIYSLNDSLKYSVMYGQGRYLSLLMPQGVYAVFKVMKKGETLELYSMSSDNDEIKKADLNKYFDNVEKSGTAEDAYYRVTIVDKKLDGYFKSPIPSKEVTRLVRVK